MVGEPGEGVQVVRGDQHRAAGGREIAQQPHDGRLRRLVDAGERLIQQQDLRLLGDRAGDEGALALLRAELGQEKGTGEVVATLRTGTAIEPTLCLGRAFALDGEMAERLASAPGLAKVELTTRRGGGHLRLVA